MTKKYVVDTLEGYTPLADDEPTFTFRAQDRFMPLVLELYGAWCEDAGSSEEHVISTNECRLAAIEWQRQNGCRLPD